MSESNEFFNIDDLPLLGNEKEMVLEWFARKLWNILEEGSGEPEYYCKHYDPLTIKNNIAHSYVFDLEDGGRHHPFKNFQHLEDMLVNEGVKRIKQMLNEKVNADKSNILL